MQGGTAAVELVFREEYGQVSGTSVRPRSRENLLLAECRIRSEAFVEEVRGGRRWPPGQGSHEMTQYLISFDEAR
jgi:hypothetical protein